MTSHIILFIASSALLALSAKWTVDALGRIAFFSRWREFVVAFFAVSLGAVAPEFFIGITSALKGVPELSLGNIVGQNIILLTVAVAVSVFALGRSMEIESRTVKASATFASIAAILPLVLAWDGNLSRSDGLILILSFALFVYWLFKKEDRFTKIYEGVNHESTRGLADFFKDAAVVAAGVIVVVLSAEGLVRSALSFSAGFGIAPATIGVLIVAAGTGFPETYFAVKLARKGYSWMILGGLMGSVAISSTLVLGAVSIIRPIEIADISDIAVSRVFLVISALAFLFFMRTKSSITIKEASILLGIYALFVISVFLF